MARKHNKPNSPVSLISFFDKKNTISEQFRAVRSNINFSMVDTELSTLMVTSAGANEGKSTAASNLAVVFADTGKRVLLVDADLRKPTVGMTFNISNNNGLSDYLRNRGAKPQDYVHENMLRNLSVLTSGAIPPNPSEMLGSLRMEEVLNDLKKHYDLIIFDCPPVATVTDAQIVGAIVDATVLVVRQRATKKADLELAKQRLDMANANIVGVVYNDVTSSPAGSYYYSEGV
jgi:capsular exopolysaccharide synthesis family protein